MQYGGVLHCRHTERTFTTSYTGSQRGREFVHNLSGVYSLLARGDGGLLWPQPAVRRWAPDYLQRGMRSRLATDANQLLRFSRHNRNARHHRLGSSIMPNDVRAVHELPGVYGLLAASDRSML